MSDRIVITGMGWVTPLGSDLESVWQKLLAGTSGVGPVTRYKAGTFRTNFAAEVRDFDLSRFLGDRAADHVDAGLSSKFALGAAHQAFTQAGLAAPLSSGKLKGRRFGIYLGAGEGQLDFDNYAEANVSGWNSETNSLDSVKWAKAAYATMTPVREIEQEPQMTLAHVASAFGCRGPSSNCMTACAASTQAVGEAYEILKRGDADVMFAGGSHSMIHPLGMTGFIRLTAMSRRTDSPATAARPFDSTRDGFVMGEGAAMLVLERESHALARGATPLAEIAGYGSTADAFRITDIAPEHRGAQGAMQQALRQAGINPREPGPDGRPPVQYYCAHGTGTKENDKLETAALKAVFGSLASQVAVSSVKSMMGHLIQAAGAAGTIVCAQSVRTGMIPPTINYEHPDPECDLDVVPNTARDLRNHGGVNVCLNNSAGFGGQNDVVCVRKYQS
jgi:3-oxoacyl-[acyl-carrier-protein] synthase II